MMRANIMYIPTCTFCVVRHTEDVYSVNDMEMSNKCDRCC